MHRKHGDSVNAATKTETLCTCRCLLLFVIHSDSLAYRTVSNTHTHIGKREEGGRHVKGFFVCDCCPLKRRTDLPTIAVSCSLRPFSFRCSCVCPPVVVAVFKDGFFPEEDLEFCVSVCPRYLVFKVPMFVWALSVLFDNRSAPLPPCFNISSSSLSLCYSFSFTMY